MARIGLRVGAPLAALLTAVWTVSGFSAAAAQVASPAPLELVSTASAVIVERLQGRPFVTLDLGAFMVAGRSPFEIHVKRRSYHDPIVATQIVRDHGRVHVRPVASDVVNGFDGLRDFFHLSLTDAAGQQVLNAEQGFCPNGRTMRLRPAAPHASPYPPSCPTNPFTLGSVWGVQSGWGTSTGGATERVNTAGVPDGVYTARLTVTGRYRDVFRIPANTVTVEVTLRTVPVPLPTAAPGAASPLAATTGPAAGPHGPRPDLIPLPAWAIDILGDNPRTPQVEPERLTFAANVWNAGPSPLVVDGFRRPNEAVMDSYQYFYDADGNAIGHAPVGSMEWDDKDGHRHWHFRDFAGYRLLDSDLREVVRSQKEAFCLANTDAINLFVRNADWQPDNTDLHTSCGNADSQTVRQVLATGHGDTYPNSAPGRAVTIQDLPNGTYYIQVVANPDNVLYESNPHNNVSLRKVVLGGTPGARTFLVPPYGLVDTDPTG
ncbi:lysyl oxidase family protein [Allorhizocola rhizosphaerae]|uniref:lysyl oxidase family protein n=1 Tax=Allorhizocola rhizosphaerae TaxID=1872709 RepID=UPI001B8C832A|nr:lysyl oxidase family protein [Allorhizocola rhizosphaerae]